jgi:putative DNA primase/helicase
MARLNGIHFANISEPDKGLVLNAALIKSITGNDSIIARFLHEISFEFRPQHKFYVNTNHLPVVTDTTLFTSGRINVIPFERHFADGDQDKTLKAMFARPSAQSAILNWLLEGWRLLEADGLKQPDSVKAATDDYHHDSDKMGLFVEDCLDPVPNDELRTSAVYRRYEEWCKDNGCFAENSKNFRHSLEGAVGAANITRRRPRTGGSETTLLLGYQIINNDGTKALR